VTFTAENLKYCLLTFDQPVNDHVVSYAKDPLCLSGLFLWGRALGGEYGFPVFPKDTEKYNLIHVNITPNNIPLLSKLLPMVNRNITKLIFNVDHSVDMWNRTFPWTQQLLEVLDKADYVFAVEPYQAEILTDALKREVPVIPHPVDIRGLKKKMTEQRDQRIGVSMHRYDANTVLPWYAVNDLPYGWVVSAIGSTTISPPPKIHHLYPEVQMHLKFEELMNFVATLYAMIESYTITSYGRTTVECAALRVPVIGWRGVASQERCFPALTMQDYFNPVTAKRLLHRLIHEPEFHRDVTRHADKASEYYSVENAKVRMLEFLNKPQ
jgi:hypothetical protein